MGPEERPEQIEAVNDYVDALLENRTPRAGRLQGEDVDMLRMAALLASAQTPRSQPSASFVDQLQARLAGDRRQWWNLGVSRRGFAGGLAAAAGALVAALAGRGVWQRVGGIPSTWVPIAQAADLPPGTVQRFTSGDVQGHLMNISGKIWALSAICTHQTCDVQWQAPKLEFVCPCHGAEFDVDGQQTGTDAYGYALKPLPRLPVQQVNGTIYLVPA